MRLGKGQREIGHLHGHGRLDIPFNKSLRDEAVRAGRAQPHHIFPRSAWVSFYVCSEEDVPNAVDLLRRNYARWQELDGGHTAMAATSDGVP